MEFRKDINGLRAIAVMAVVLYHFNASLMPGGFAGVDVFFVISGFLMTGIIFRGLDNKNFSILRFYTARANRIVPALAILCMVLLFLGWFFLTPYDYKSLGKHAVSSIGFISNFVYWRESGYFEATSHEKWLLHTWSLSAEWQFYIIYPIFLVLMQKIVSLKTIKTTILVGTLFGFIFCVMATYKWPNPSYYLLPTRAWEMMLGGVAYLYPFKLKSQGKRIIEALGLAFIVSSYFLISKNNPWPGYLAFFPVLGSFLIIQAQRNDSFFTNNYLFQKIGSWSYSIYLWHWPLVVCVYYFSLGDMFIYFGVLLSVLFGFLSNRYVESIRFRNDFNFSLDCLKCKPIYFALVAGTVGWGVLITDGVNNPIRSMSVSDEAKYISKYSRDNYRKYLTDAYRLECDFFDGDSYISKSEGIPEECTNNGVGGVFIWGDSHAQALSYGIRELFQGVNINQVATSSCRPLVKEDNISSGEFKHACDRSNERAKKEILKIKPDVIILAQRIGHDKNNYNEILNYLHEYGVKSKLILVGPVPQWELSLPSIIAKRHFKTDERKFLGNSFVDEVFEINSALHLKYNGSGIKHISIIDGLCDRNGCIAKVDDMNTPLVWDYGHLSLEGSKYVVDKLLKSEIYKYL